MALFIHDNHFHIISLFLFLFLITLPTSISQQYNKYEECQIKPYTCGGLPDAYYPFWGGNRSSYCGSNTDQFRLKCDPHQNTSIQIASQNFHVLRINQLGYTITMFRKGLVYDNCSSSSALTNTSLDSRNFHYMPNVRNITILYNCPNDIKFLNGTNANVNSFSCKEDEKTRAFYADSALAEGIKCDGVRIEVQVTQEVEHAGGIEGLNKALSSGFDVKYISYTQECLKCILSNGTCGGNHESQFSCYCPDGTEGLDCSHHRDNGWNWKKKFGVGVAVAAVGSAIFVGIGFYIYYGRKKKKNIHTVSSTALSRSISSSSSENSENGSKYHGVHFFTYSELEKATNYFDSTAALGDGGFGTVYFGKLRDGRLVAVKRMNENNYRRVEQFVNEVEILTGLHHQNLVSLYGCTSRHSRELLLVYEYVPNGTVADHLHGKKAKPGMLPWHIRMNIAIETASALVYLHATDIIHRDVKTTNILLDSHFSVKVGDFGLSRLFPIHVTHISTAPQGTPGYVDPEYHLYYQLTDKSDVFSFGVVLIELISSMPAVDILRNRQDINLSNMAIKKIQNGTLNELVDPTLGFESDFKVRKMINAVAELAFQCLQSSKDDRPSMVKVLERLKDIQSDDGTYKCKPEVLDISVDNDDITLIKNDPPPSSPDSNIIIFP